MMQGDLLAAREEAVKRLERLDVDNGRDHQLDYRLTTRMERNIGEPMDLEFFCRQCGGTVDAHLADLAEEPNVICPDCGEEADPTLVADVAGATEELLATASRLRKFHLRLELDSSEDRPQIYVEDEEDEEEDDEDEDLDDDY